MRILYIAAWFPYPLDNGARIRTHYLLKALAQHHDVYLISLLQEDSDPANVFALERFCSVISLHPSRWFKPSTMKSLLGFFSATPRSVVDTYDANVSRAVRDAVRSVKPEVIVASTLGSAVYVPHRAGIRTVLDEHNCEYAVMKRGAEGIPNSLMRFRYDLGWKKSARWEAGICRRFDSVTMVSERDIELLSQVAPALRSVSLIPNGVDTSFYTPLSWRPEPGALLYNGAMTYNANLDAVRFFASEVYPLLVSKLPDARLRVTGRTSGVDLTGLAESQAVDFTGYVADIRDVLKRSAVCVVPLRQGGGSRLKILEAMASGVPVVSTTLGAEGLDVVSGTHMVLADTPSELAEAILAVHNDVELARKLSEQARRLVEERYSWDRIGDVFTNVISAQQARQPKY